MNSTLDKKRQNIETLVKIGAALLVGFLVAPFIFVAIKGLIGLAVAALIGTACIFFTPWVAAMFANWRLKAIKHEASKNPIETLQNDYQSRVEALQAFRESIRSFAGEVTSFKGKAEEFKEKYPKEAARFDEQLQKMVSLLNLRKNKYEEAKSNIALYAGEIDKAKAIWEMSQAAAAMNKAAGMNADEFFAKIQVETALDSVQKSLSTAFSDLEISLLDEKPDNKSKVTVEPAAAPKQVSDKVADSTLDLCIDVEATRV